MVVAIVNQHGQQRRRTPRVGIAQKACLVPSPVPKSCSDPPRGRSRDGIWSVPSAKKLSLSVPLPHNCQVGEVGRWEW